MRILHSSDWHLGRSFFGASLIEDQVRALDELLRVAVESKVDVVVIAGDVYDRSSPPADAVRLLDDTLMRLVIGHAIPVVMIAGNHDSGDRLGFASRLLLARGLHVAGSEPLVAHFGDEHGPVDIVAIPFAEPPAVAARHGNASIADHDAALRAELASMSGSAAGEPPELSSKPASEVPSPSAPAARQNGTGSSQDAHGAAAVKKAAATPGARRRIAVAHAFVSGGASCDSERPLVMGNAALVAAECFDGFSYAALGHLHRPQRAGRREVRYSGSLLKYSFDEASHRKSVSIVEIGADGNCSIEELELGLRRNVRVLEGTLEELLRSAAGDTAREDYVLARLSDRAAVLDAIGKLRLFYPNCLRVDHQAFFAARQQRAEGRAAPGSDPLSQNESLLFDAFFRDVTGEAPADDEARAFADALAALRREAEAA